MKKVLFFSAVALSAIMMVSCNKPAAQTEEKEAIEQAASQEMDAIRTALALAQYGYAAESPAALIEAADILASTPVQPVAVEGEVGAQNENEGEKAAKAEVTVEQLLADARALTEDANLLALADKVAAKAAEGAEATRGAYGGPKYQRDRVYSHSYIQYVQAFYANQIAEVSVVGDGDTDLDLYIYDENGNLIVSDTGYTDRCYVRWCPRWTGNFLVRVVNRGGVYNNFTIATN